MLGWMSANDITSKRGPHFLHGCYVVVFSKEKPSDRKYPFKDERDEHLKPTFLTLYVGKTTAQKKKYSKGDGRESWEYGALKRVRQSVSEVSKMTGYPKNELWVKLFTCYDDDPLSLSDPNFVFQALEKFLVGHALIANGKVPPCNTGKS
jgi:hypothetical protein